MSEGKETEYLLMMKTNEEEIEMLKERLNVEEMRAVKELEQVRE